MLAFKCVKLNFEKFNELEHRFDKNYPQCSIERKRNAKYVIGDETWRIDLSFMLFVIQCINIKNCASYLKHHPLSPKDSL